MFPASCDKNLLAFVSPLGLAILLFAASPVHADVRLHGLFGNNMVLQQDARIPVWGWADPDEKVVLTLGAQTASATPDAKGRWIVWLEPCKAGGPMELVVAGKNTITIRNVLVGEVWIGSGQSNMHWPVKQSTTGAQAIAEAGNYPAIREFRMSAARYDQCAEPLDNVRGAWQCAGPKTAGGFSAVGYFFMQEVQNELRVPMGFIHVAEGTTPVSSWMSLDSIRSLPALKPLADAYAVESVKRPLNDRAVPGFWYNNCIAPLVPYALRGVLWYQGESGAGHGVPYGVALPTLIRGWRRAWGQGDFPFLFVQMPNYYKHLGNEDGWQTLPVEPAGNEDFPATREGQLLTWLSTPNTGMAITIDLGTPRDVHPPNKHEFAHRLALVALATVYGRKLEYSGPIYRSMTVEDGRVRLYFDHVAGGLTTRDGQPLRGFAVAGDDGKFVWAQAKIDGPAVVAWSDQVRDLKAVRYSWAKNPIGNLNNSAGLPASPFRTDVPGVGGGRGRD